MGHLKLRVTGGAMVALAFWLLVGDARWTFAALVSAAVHELGHLTAIWLCGVRVLGMELRFGGAVIETEPLTDREELLCALSGPAAGALLCLFWRMMPRIGLCALVQTVFNLIPLYPLDGGRAFRVVRNICCKDDGFGVQ